MKSTDRRRRVADEIKRIVAITLQNEVNNFDMSRVTILRCEVTGDLSEAVVRYSVLGDNDLRRDCARNLARVAGFVQRRVADQVKMYRCPHIRFRFDSSMDDVMNLEKLFDRIARERDTNE